MATTGGGGMGGGSAGGGPAPIGIDPRSVNDLLPKLVTGLEQISRLLRVIAGDSDTFQRSMGGARRSISGFSGLGDHWYKAHAMAQKALDIGAKSRGVTRQMAVEHTKLTLELAKEEKQLQALIRTYLKAGGSSQDFYRKAASGMSEGAKVIEKIERINERKGQIERAAGAKQGLVAQVAGRWFGPDVGSLVDRFGQLQAIGSRKQVSDEILRGRALGRIAGDPLGFTVKGRRIGRWTIDDHRFDLGAAGEMAGGAYGAVKGAVGMPLAVGGRALMQSLPYLGATAAGYLGKSLFDFTRQGIVLSKQFDALVNRSNEIGSAMRDVTSTIAMSARESSEFLSRMHDLGIQATEVNVVAKDMLVTERGLNVSLESQVRLFKLVSRELTDGTREIGEAAKQSQHAVRVAAMLGQQLRSFTPNEMIEGTTRLAELMDGIKADATDLPQKFVMLNTAAGLAALGLGKARGMTDAMAKSVGQVVMGLQSASPDAKLLGIQLAFPGRDMDEYLSILGDLETGRMSNRGTGGLNEQLRIALSGTELAISDVFRSRPELRDAVRGGDAIAVSKAASSARLMLKDLPGGLSNLREQSPAAYANLTERLVRQYAESGSLVGEADSLKRMYDEMLEAKEINREQYDKLTKLDDIASVEQQTLDQAKTIAAAQHPIKQYLEVIAARALGKTGTGLISWLTGGKIRDQETYDRAERFFGAKPTIEQAGRFVAAREKLEGMVGGTGVFGSLAQGSLMGGRDAGERVRSIIASSNGDIDALEKRISDMERVHAESLVKPTGASLAWHAPGDPGQETSASPTDKEVERLEFLAAKAYPKTDPTRRAEFAKNLNEAKRKWYSLGGLELPPDEALVSIFGWESAGFNPLAESPPDEKGRTARGLAQSRRATWEGWTKKSGPFKTWVEEDPKRANWANAFDPTGSLLVGFSHMTAKPAGISLGQWYHSGAMAPGAEFQQFAAGIGEALERLGKAADKTALLITAGKGGHYEMELRPAPSPESTVSAVAGLQNWRDSRRVRIQ